MTIAVSTGLRGRHLSGAQVHFAARDGVALRVGGPRDGPRFRSRFVAVLADAYRIELRAKPAIDKGLMETYRRSPALSELGGGGHPFRHF